MVVQTGRSRFGVTCSMWRWYMYGYEIGRAFLTLIFVPLAFWFIFGSSPVNDTFGRDLDRLKPMDRKRALAEFMRRMNAAS
jgi:hypothetical protein